MAKINQYNPFVRISDNLMVLNRDNHIVTAGADLKEVLFKGQKVLPDFLANFSDPKEKAKVKKILQELMDKQTSISFKIRGQKVAGICQAQPGNNSIIIFKEERKSRVRDEDLDKVERNLKERVKELTCLFNISIAVDKASTIKEAMINSLGVIQKGIQYPKISNVTFALDNKNYILNPKEKVKKKSISSDLIVCGVKRGFLKVSYKEDKEFLREEKQLIDEISLSFSKTIERVESRADLEKQKKILLRKNKKLLELTEECGQGRTKLEAMLKAMEGRIIMVDKNRNIILSNRPGIKESDKCYKALFKCSTHCTDCPLERVFKENRSISIERIDKNTYFDLQFFPVNNEKNEVETVLEICTDVTKEKSMEFQLIQSYKMASLGKLIAGIAHEINNPNTFIQGNIKIIRESMGDIFPILEQEYKNNRDLRIARLNYDIFKENIPVLIDDMVEGSDRIKKIVYGLRNYARKDEGSMNDKVDINQMIESSLRLVSNQLRKTANVQKSLLENIPKVKGSMQKLEQVVVNLLVNASQAIKDGQKGLIKVITDYDEELNEVIIIISDNGSGMDNKTQKFIFDPFFTTKRARGGTGLGLSISYGIIKEHNGRIMVNSQPEEGTVFTINLPGDQK